MNKKGFLLGEETVKIILAVIVILFLVFFLVSLYNHYSSNKELKYAKASLNYLRAEINSGSERAEIYNPSGWYISSFPSTSSGHVWMPRECSSMGWENCICIYSPKVKNLVGSSFDVVGYCKKSDFVVEGSTKLNNPDFTGPYENSIEINPPLSLLINQTNKTIQRANEH